VNDSHTEVLYSIVLLCLFELPQIEFHRQDIEPATVPITVPQDDSTATVYDFCAKEEE
jgi:hypothetical protein